MPSREITPYFYQAFPHKPLVCIRMEFELDACWYITGFYAKFQEQYNRKGPFRNEVNRLVIELKGVGRKLLCGCIDCICQNPKFSYDTPIELFAMGSSEIARQNIRRNLHTIVHLYPGKTADEIVDIVSYQNLLKMYQSLGFQKKEDGEDYGMGGGQDMRSTLGVLKGHCK